MERTHPTFFPLQEQWEQHTQAIQALRIGKAFIRLSSDRVQRVRTPTLSAVQPDPHDLADVQAYYRDTYFRPFPSGEQPTTTAVCSARRLVISRQPPRKPTTQTVFPAPEPELAADTTLDVAIGRIRRTPRP